MEGSRPLGVMEMTLKLFQYISIQIETPVKVHSVFRGDSHKCRLFCWRCFFPIGDSDDLAQLLSSAQIKILLHHRLFLCNDNLQGENWKNKGDEYFEDLYHVTPPLFSGSGELRKAIKRDNQSNAEYNASCLYGEDIIDWSDIFLNDRNHQHLASFEASAKVDVNYLAEEGIMAERLLYTRRLVYILFERMAKVADHLKSVQEKPQGARHWSGYAGQCEDPGGAEVINGAS